MYKLQQIIDNTFYRLPIYYYLCLTMVLCKTIIHHMFYMLQQI